MAYKNKADATAYSIRYRQTHKQQKQENNRKYYQNNREQFIEVSKERLKLGIDYKGVFIYLGYNPRKGTCLSCDRTVKSGEIERTNLHHEYYNDDDVIDGTIEVCVRCHKERHAWLDLEERESLR